MVINSVTLNKEDPALEHSRPSIRMCKVDKNESGSCGFHLTRTKWDPYPWIAGVDDGSPAQAAGLKVGDCVLEVNGEDVLGLRVGEVADKALSGHEYIVMLLWNAGSDPNCDSESLCCTPMPTSLSRLSSCLSSILSFLECPICFEIISPPAHQCSLGHLICFRCRVYIDRCPICRTGFTRERSLLADQIYNSIVEAFHLNNHTTAERTKKLWERIFGKKKREKSLQSPTPKISRAIDIKNKFLTRLIGKSSSVDNLTTESMFTASLRKKSISSTDVYPESLKKLNYLYNNADQCSSESLPQENGIMSNYSSTNSCDTLNVGRNVQYYNRLRNRNFNENTENLFQFSSDVAVDDDIGSNLFHCPILDSCVPVTAYSLLTHLQQHDGPVIQYFRPNITIHFPFSFENGAVFIIHCYEKTFFVKIHIALSNDIKLFVWIMDTRTEAERFKLEVSVRGVVDPHNMLKFETFTNSINSTESIEDIYKPQILITESTLQAHFHEKFYSLDLHFKNHLT